MAFSSAIDPSSPCIEIYLIYCGSFWPCCQSVEKPLMSAVPSRDGTARWWMLLFHSKCQRRPFICPFPYHIRWLKCPGYLIIRRICSDNLRNSLFSALELMRGTGRNLRLAPGERAKPMTFNNAQSHNVQLAVIGDVRMVPFTKHGVKSSGRGGDFLFRGISFLIPQKRIYICPESSFTL